MNNNMKNAAYWPVYDTVVGPVDDAVDVAVDDAVDDTVDDAMNVYWAVSEPLYNNIRTIINQMTEDK